MNKFYLEGNFAPVRDEVAAYDLPVHRGVLVVRLGSGGPAARAGMRAGDIIVAVAGQPVRNLVDLRTAITGRKVGETVDVAVRREKMSLTLKVTLAEQGAPR